MFFLGYHGTSEASAISILNEGVRRDRLPPTGQLGPGFYIAKMNGTLPQWGADWATDGARRRLNLFQKIVSLISEAYNPFIANNAKRTILKIYATRPLTRCQWSIMNPQNLNTIRAFVEQEAGQVPESRKAVMQTMIDNWSRWLQMVVPPEELQYLVARRDDGVPEVPQFWYARESPY